MFDFLRITCSLGVPQENLLNLIKSLTSTTCKSTCLCNAPSMHTVELRLPSGGGLGAQWDFPPLGGESPFELTYIIFQVTQKQVGKRSLITFWVLGILSVNFLVTFSDASVTFFVPCLPNSSCRTPFAAGCYDLISFPFFGVLACLRACISSSTIGMIK